MHTTYCVDFFEKLVNQQSHILTKEQNKILDGNIVLKDFNNLIFNNLAFSYNENVEVLKDFDFEIKKGQITAIVGYSGAGKSTLLNLIFRLYDPQNGEIKINGIDLKKYKLSSWLKMIGYVSQDTFLFNATIYQNIVFGNSGYTKNDIVNAAKEAHAHDFISSFSEKYDIIIGDRGINLSGGQAQRIAIARALITNPEILIFDEATSSLDNISEKIVQKSIYDVSKKRTALIIAHRLSTVKDADMIYVLDKGQIIEKRKHDELDVIKQICLVVK